MVGDAQGALYGSLPVSQALFVLRNKIHNDYRHLRECLSGQGGVVWPCVKNPDIRPGNLFQNHEVARMALGVLSRGRFQSPTWTWVLVTS